MRLLLGLSWLFWMCLSGPAAGQQVQEAEIRFEIANAGLTVDGTLSGLQATVQFDPARLEQSRIQASVPVSSIKTGIGLRDRHLLKPEYFDAAKYPAITMQSTAFRKTGPNQFEGVFTLTIKGVQREVKMPFTVSGANEFQGRLSLNRLDYNVGKVSLLLSDKVAVTIRMKSGKGA
ncbi:YceI family protein [Hymenobacter arizonensis]|uniref:Polyisoprenoid-binding protein YceI n=1 Tax=Hymenobacter arizonensis TaxID=1227077 RepID=A0A1I5ZBQ9_HYMAR|nr:YceI family protein [Hymenobacter arizonensis]SFQ53889.1 Polyisoprenoid-binding protein YceI [Hymenobacter arizonensis]